MQIHAFDAPLGAEITDFDPRLPMSTESRDALDHALMRYQVLRIRGAVMSPEELWKFSKQFGVLRKHVAKSYRLNDLPEVVMMTNQDEAGNFDKTGAGRGVGWHSDGTFEADPPRATILHAIAMPTEGGETQFVSTCKAYERLPLDLRGRVDGKMAVFRLRGRQHHTQNIVHGDDLKKLSDATHPVIRPHPRTGRKSVFANPHHTLRIVGLVDDESEALLNDLEAFCTRAEFMWQQAWKAGDTVIWDNHSTWHRGRGNNPKDQLRKFMRTTVCE
jgi:taurine dioxygenase